MLKIVFIFLLSFNLIGLYSQKYNQFEFNTDSDFCCTIYISLYPANKFVIDFIYDLSDDVSAYGVFCLGKYYKNSSSFIFIDEFTKNKFVIKKEKGKYICEKLFEFMIGKEIKLGEGNLEDYKRVEIAYGDINSRKHALFALLNNKSEIKSNFKPSLYFSPRPIESRDFYFTFNQNRTFLFILDRKILLKGKWEIKGNILSLKDEHFTNPFYMQIKSEEELVCLTIPGLNFEPVFTFYKAK